MSTKLSCYNAIAGHPGTLLPPRHSIYIRLNHFCSITTTMIGRLTLNLRMYDLLPVRWKAVRQYPEIEYDGGGIR